MRCDEHEIDLSAKDSKNEIVAVYSDGNDFNFGEGDQRPTNPDSSDLSSRQSNSYQAKFKKDNQEQFEGSEKM